ncbi:MAG: extracellular solute-binding protein [Clostridia bacterium]|nr:extracellular solute-binding protein [Clostridia bacterium]
MRRNFKVTCGFLAALLLLAGCGKGAQDNIGNEEQKKLDLAAANTRQFEMPLTDKPVKLSVVTNSSVNVAGKSYTYNEVKAFQEMERRSGIEVEFQHVQNEKINLLFASNALPDLLLLNWSGFGGALKHANDRQIIALDSYIEKYAPNLVNIMKEDNKIYLQLAEADGRIYNFPFIRGEEELRVFQGFMIRQDWLDKLGLEMPTTRDEFYNVLKAFRNGDPNGNGEADETPYLAEKSYGIDRMYNFWGKDVFYVDNGTVKCGWTEPEYKEYIEWMNKLYSEGLIDPDYMINDRNQFDQKVARGLGGVWYGPAGGCLGRLTTLMEPVDPEFDLVGMPWIKAADGNKYVVNSEFVAEVTGMGYAVSSSCKNIEEAVKWMDYAYSDEGQILFNFGIEGESYTMENGVPTYTDLIVNNPDGLAMNEATALYAVPFGYPMSQSIDYFNQSMSARQKAAIAVWKDVDVSGSIPTLKYTVDEYDDVMKKFNEIKSYNDEMVNKFIVGKEPISNYDKYVQTIKSMGIDSVVEAYRKAYDRYVNLTK